METRSRKRAEATARRPPPAQSSRAKRARHSGATSSGTPVRRPNTRNSSAAAAASAAAATIVTTSVSQEATMDSTIESGSRKDSKRDKDKLGKRDFDKEDDQKALRGVDDKGKEKELDKDGGRERNVGTSADGDEENDGEGVSTLQQNLASASSALHGLLRKLGAGFDEFLPSATPSAHQSSRLKRILSGLRAEGEEGRQLEALSQLCEMLSIGTEDSLGGFGVDSFVPVLVGLLNHEYNPDVMLLAARALTHLCDVLPSSCAAVVHYGAVPCFCQRLLTIEYIDLAEQSLQALKKISHEHPTPCLRAGALIAVLSYLDFFSTGVQRVAVSTAANICRQLPTDASVFVMESVPILTNLLQYQDSKVVEHASVCLTRIADSFANSSEKIDMFCSHGLIPLAARLISVSNTNGSMVPQTSLSALTYTGLIRLLSSCASGSAAAAESLLLLNISKVLKDILTGAGLISSTSVGPSINRLPDQLYEIVNLVNELLPPVPDPSATSNGAVETRSSRRGSKEEPSPREKLLLDRPEVLVQFGSDLFPVLVQVYGSSVAASVRHKCLVALHKLLHYSTAEMLDILTKDTNISSFLAGVLASKDSSVLIAALQIAELLMQKLPALFSKTFVKEGVVHAIDVLIASDQSVSSANKNGDAAGTSPFKPRRAVSNRRRSNDQADETAAAVVVGSPPLGTEPLQAARTGHFITAVAKAKRLKELHFSSDSVLNDSGATDSLLKLKSLSAKVHAESALETRGKGKGKAKTTSLSDDQMLGVISDILSELVEGDGVSTFEFVNSGVVTALLHYFSCAGLTKEGAADDRMRVQALKRLKQFLAASLPPEGEEPPLTVLVRKLQNALGSLERFPVILSHGPRASGTTASIAAGLSALTQPFKLRLCRAAGDKVLRDYSSNIVLIEPLATLAAVEDFLWPRVKRPDASPVSTAAASSSDGVASPVTPVAAAVSTSNSARPSTRSRTAAKDAETGSSKGKGKAKSTAERNASEQRGPETRNAAARRKAQAAANAAKQGRGGASGVLESEDDEASPVEVEDAAMDEDDLSEDGEEDEDEVFGEETGGVCIGDRVHDVQLGETGAVSASVASETPTGFTSGVTGRSTVLISGTEPSGSRTTAAIGGKSALSFAAAAMASGGNNGGRSGRDRRSLAAIVASNVPAKLSFFLGGKQLNRSLTIFQAIQRQTASEEDEEERYAGPEQPTANGRRLWDEIYTITYQRTDDKVTTNTHSKPSSQSINKASSSSASSEGSWQQASLMESVIHGQLPCDLDKSNSTYNILLLLRVLEGLNRLAPRLRAQGSEDAFAEGRISSLGETSDSSGGALVAQEEFLSSKLTPKLARQMQDALALCSGGLPAWCHQLTRACPFLFPFETRRQYFHSTAFGLSRALQRLQQQQSADGSSSSSDRELRVGRLQRQKVRVSRSRILDSATKVMELYCGHKAVLEVEYFGEVGTGLGPTLEFYTLLSHELQKSSLELWRNDTGLPITAAAAAAAAAAAGTADVEMQDAEEESFEDPLFTSATTTNAESMEQNVDFIHAPQGLFPRPWLPTTESSTNTKYAKVLEYFRLLGRVMAKALQDGRLLDLPFSVPFYKLVLGQELDLYDVKSVDPVLGSTLDELQALVRRKQYLEINGGSSDAEDGMCFRGSKVEDLCLDFTLPGYPEFYLKGNGNDITVSIDNLEEYITLVVDATVKKGISSQLEAFRAGFSQVFQLSSLQIFTEQELDYLLCGRKELWTAESLVDHIKFDHGYTSTSPPVRHLLEIMGEFSPEEQRDFLRFVTGAPRLPPGGLSALNPKLTIVRKHPTGGGVVLSSTPPGAASAMGTTLADGDLPSVMTCANYLKLPPYSCKEVMRERLVYAISEGQGSFDLS